MKWRNFLKEFINKKRLFYLFILFMILLSTGLYFFQKNWLLIQLKVRLIPKLIMQEHKYKEKILKILLSNCTQSHVFPLNFPIVRVWLSYLLVALLLFSAKTLCSPRLCGWFWFALTAEPQSLQSFRRVIIFINVKSSFEILKIVIQMVSNPDFMI